MSRRKPEIMVVTSLQAESYLLITPITSQTCHAKLQNSNQQAPDATSFSPAGDAYRKQSFRTFSEKSGRCGIAADYSVALYL